MTYVLFYLIGLVGGSATFASEDLCWKAGERMIKEFNPPCLEDNVLKCVARPRVQWFCQPSGFKVPS